MHVQVHVEINIYIYIYTYILRTCNIQAYVCLRELWFNDLFMYNVHVYILHVTASLYMLYSKLAAVILLSLRCERSWTTTSGSGET